MSPRKAARAAPKKTPTQPPRTARASGTVRGARRLKPAAAGRAGKSGKEHQRHLAEAEHAHRDPRIEQAGIHGAAPGHHDPRKDGGLAKDRIVARMKPQVNWFRRAPKHKTR
jgi:hypothetical protein